MKTVYPITLRVIVPPACWCLSTLFLSGCEVEEQGRMAYTVVDSAGVSIVEVDSLDAPLEWRLSESPVWVFTDAADEPVHDVVDVAFVAADRIAVADRSRSLLIVLDTLGQVVARGGGPGQGPGEFRRISAIVPGGGSTFEVLDAGNQNLSTWSVDGDFRGAIVFPEAARSSLPTVLRRSAGGYYVAAQEAPFAEDADTVMRAPAAVFVWDGAAGDTLIRPRGNEYFRAVGSMGSPAYAGATIVQGRGSGVWIGDTKRTEVEYWTDIGLTRRLRWPGTPVAMTDEVMSRYIDAVLAAVPPEAASPMRQMMGQIPRVTTLPVWERLLVTADEELWISPQVTMRLPPEISGQLQPRQWILFNSTGLPLAKLVAPAGFDVRDGSGDLIVGLQTDELGVQSVRVYRLARM